MGEVLDEEMHDPAHEQSDHDSDGETAPAPKEGPTRSPESRPGSSLEARAVLSCCACQIGFLLAVLYGLPTGALACAKVLLHFAASPEKCPATCKAMVLRPLSEVKVNCPMVGSWGHFGLALWGTQNNPDNDLLCRWRRMCPTNWRAHGFLTWRAPLRQAQRSATWQCGPWAAHCFQAWKGHSLGSQPSRKGIFKAGALKTKPRVKADIWSPNLPKSCHLMHMRKVIFI